MAYVISDECVSCGSCAAECHLRQFLKAQIISKSMQTLALTAEHVQMFVLQRLSSQENNPTDYIQKKKRRAAANAAALFCFIYSYVFSGFFLIFYPLKRQRLRVWQAAVF